MESIILRNDIENIPIKKFIYNEYSIHEENIFFYIGDEITKDDEVEMIKLYKFPLAIMRNYEFITPKVEGPYEFIPYTDILVKGDKIFNIFKCIMTLNFKKTYFSRSMLELMKKWHTNKEYELIHKDVFGYSLENIYFDLYNQIINNPILKLDDSKIVQIRGIMYPPKPPIIESQLPKTFQMPPPLKFIKSDLPKITKIHLSIKPEYLLYATELIIKNYLKLMRGEPLNDDMKREIIKIIPEISEDMFILKRPNFDYFKIIPDFFFSYLSSEFNKNYKRLPSIAFYPYSFLHCKEIINGLKEIFSEEIINKISLNTAPRYNLRINKIIYISFGDGDGKEHNYSYNQPTEYIKLEETCKTKMNEIDCLKINEFSQAYSDHDICIFDKSDNKCKKNDNIDRLSLVYNFGKYNKLETIYNELEIESKPAKIEDFEKKYKKYKMKYLALKQYINK